MATKAQKVTYAEVAAPATPAATEVVTYAKADGLMYSKDDAGTETLMSSGGTATRASLGLATSDSPEFAALNVGAATDTTITRTGAGEIAVEGNRIFRVGGADVPIADGGTGASTATAAFDALSPMTTAGDLIVGGASGTRTRLAKGSDGDVLTVDPTTHLLVWAAPSGGSGSVATDTIWNAKGDLAGGTGSDTAARLAVGTNGDVLTADSGETTGMKWAAPSGGSGALVLLEQHTASASATLDFTAFISSTYDEYVFEGLYLVPASNSVALMAQAGTGGGPTYDTAANYYTPSNQSGWFLAATVTNAAAYGQASFSARLVDPQSTTRNKSLFGPAAYHDGAGVQVATTGGLWAVTTAITAIRFKFASGNITSGVIRVYGITK